MNAPRSKPKSSDSSSSDGSAAQLTFTNVRSLPRRAAWIGARDELLARAALAAHQHGDVGVGDAIDELAHLAHLVARAEQLADDARRRRGVVRPARRSAAAGMSRRSSDVARSRSRLSGHTHGVQFSKVGATRVKVWRILGKTRGVATLMTWS